MALTTEQPESATEEPAGRTFQSVLIAIIGVAALVLVGAGGYVLGHRTGSGSTPTASSVDAGFAWDMSVHHRQAVTMAGYVRDHSTDGVVQNLAYDIETSQDNQVGEMSGWLDAWSLPPLNPGTQMSWMDGSMQMDMSTGLMPGMATVAQVDKLEKMTGKAMDIYFLQLMLHHHQGGVEMADYAAQHAGTSYVRNFASKIAASQSSEIVLMEQLLRERGAAPLPAPA